MDSSLQVDRHRDMQSPKRSYHNEARSHIEVPERPEHCSTRSPGIGPMSGPMSPDLDSRAHLNANGAPAAYEKWLYGSPEISSQITPQSRNDSRLGHHEIEVAQGRGGQGVNDQSDISPLEASSYMRPSTHTPGVPNTSRFDAIGRRRSQSIGSGPRGSKIAALSVQLRTRLSYAAAKIEKKRHPHSIQYQPPTSLLQKNTPTPILSLETLSQTGQPLSIDDIDYQGSIESGSPNGTTVSAPEAPGTSSPRPREIHMGPTLVSLTSGLYPQPQPDPQKHVGRASSERPVPPRLAPPADVGPGRGSGQRRRPNPNIPGNSSRHMPFPLHRRHHSQQDFRVDSEIDRVPETPPLRPSTLNNLGPYNGFSDNSQNSSMEQDAIETLLFMSSPGTSGYHSNSQNSQRHQDVRNVDSNTLQGVQWHGNHDDNQSRNRQPDRLCNIETQAGDEIDLMLDQMHSDSDDDADYVSNRSILVDTDSRATSAEGHDFRYRT